MKFNIIDIDGYTNNFTTDVIEAESVEEAIRKLWGVSDEHTIGIHNGKNVMFDIEIQQKGVGKYVIDSEESTTIITVGDFGKM